MNADADAEYKKMEARHVHEWATLINRWPNFRLHFAYAMLATAIAVADSFGCDVEGFLVKLREREPKPSVLIPPKSS